ncbi:ABC transporter ATP-binding protein [Demequina lutea]|uniref:ABC-type quaternary amine transporter n=1 Tax=Demequina lutea TaxID=431489 RepID=A0A7Y9Z7F4_9MICO|nr:ABC transporter ATP-binding protein [Demequina lutea]NYI39996.1 ABC-type Fe3+/spermidine/putrescine transport system ATPase subunit [Demequina lutea]
MTGHHVIVRGASKRYGSLEALCGIDLDLAAGSFTVLLGPSGSGKSTLLRSIAGVEKLDGGTIHFGPRTISDRQTHVKPEKRALAMVFQDYALWPHLTVRQNVAYALRRRRLGGQEAGRRVESMLERVGLGAKSGSYPHELSGGQQQRVALARAIVGEPELILFDEPLSNLDADLREHLRLEIATLTRETGATALYITHDQSEAFALADEVAILNAGVIEQRGSAESIFRHPATPFVARFTGLAGSFEGVAVHVSDDTAKLQVGEHVLTTAAGRGLGVGDTAEVLVRPTATRLETVDATGPHDGSRHRLPSRIVDVAYRGRGYDHVVDTGHGLLAAVFDERPWTRGAACVASIDPAGMIAFSANV